MGKVIFNSTVSLDGFVAGPDGEVDKLFTWYERGDTEVPLPGTRMVFTVSRQSADYLQETWPTFGAMVTGRRTFEHAKGWGGRPPGGHPCFVMTHRVPEGWVYDGSPFTFVTDGIESAVAQAKEASGAKNVAISTASIMQQCLAAGLLEELHLDVAHVLLGGGVRLYGSQTAQLERLRVVAAPDVTHMQFRVLS